VTETAILNNIPGHILSLKNHISIEHEILFHLLQENRTRHLPIIQQTTLNWTLRSTNFFAGKDLWQKRE